MVHASSLLRKGEHAEGVVSTSQFAWDVQVCAAPPHVGQRHAAKRAMRARAAGAARGSRRWGWWRCSPLARATITVRIASLPLLILNLSRPLLRR